MRHSRKNPPNSPASLRHRELAGPYLANSSSDRTMDTSVLFRSVLNLSRNFRTLISHTPISAGRSPLTLTGKMRTYSTPTFVERYSTRDRLAAACRRRRLPAKGHVPGSTRTNQTNNTSSHLKKSAKPTCGEQTLEEPFLISQISISSICETVATTRGTTTTWSGAERSYLMMRDARLEVPPWTLCEPERL